MRNYSVQVTTHIRTPDPSTGAVLRSRPLKSLLPAHTLADAKEMAHVINHANRYADGYAERRAIVVMRVYIGSAIGWLTIPVDDLESAARDFTDAFETYRAESKQGLLADTRE